MSRGRFESFRTTSLLLLLLLAIVGPLPSALRLETERTRFLALAALERRLLHEDTRDYATLLAAANEGIKRFEGALPREADLAAIPEELSRFAQEAGVEVAEMRFGRERVAKDLSYHRYRVEAPISGPFAAIKKFLAKVDGSSRPLAFRSLSIAGAADGGANLSCKVTLVFHYRIEGV